MTRVGWCPGRRADESEVAATRRQLAEYPGTRVVRKFFPEQLGGWVDALSELRPGMTAVVSYHGFGAPIAAFAAAIPPGVTVRLSPWHEPEKKLTPAQLLGEFRHLDAVVPRDHPLRAAGILQFGPTMTVYRARVGVPADLRRFVTPELVELVDFVAWDWYPSNPAERTPTSPASYEPPESAFRLMLDFAAETGLPWAVSEINHEDIGTTPAADWYRAAFAYAKANGCLWWAHFHRGGGDLTNPDSPRPEMAAALRELIEQEASVTTAPDNLLAARRLLLDHLDMQPGRVVSADLDPAEVGIVGDPAHRGGYHCGSDRVVPRDYSVIESARDRTGLAKWACALDVGQFTVSVAGKRHDLRSFSIWLVAQCKAGTADTRDIREVIYSPDGTTVKRWDRLGKRTSGDSSHRWHTHISFHRDAIKAGRDQTAVFRRYLTTIGLLAAEQEDDIMATIDDLRKAIRDELREAQPIQSSGIRNANPTVNGISMRQLAEYAWSDARQANSGVAALRAQVAEVAGRDLVDEQAIVVGILAGLPAEEIAAAVPPELARQVADELAARLAQ